MPSYKAPPSLYRLKVSLLEIKPPIWRRLEVPASIKLCCLHTAVQVAMGWTDSHLHQFEKGSKRWGVPEWDEFDELGLIDERETRLDDILQTEGDSMVYQYDFGDDWQHRVVLENVLPANASARPVCIAGERRCPPEDVGGVSGYEEFLEVIFNPAHREYEHYLGWAGGHFLDQFDLKAANAKLSRMRWPVRHRW